MGLELRGIQSSIFSEPIDFTFHGQAFTLLVGSSGSGKSSLFQIIAQVISLPYSGQVLIDGSEVSQLSTVERVQTVGILFQNPNHQFTMENLFEELVFTLENIGHPLQEIDTKIAEVVRQCRCEAILHRPIHHLSGGEKQKAALAVLFAMNPRVYLLDEPFASIDRKSRLEILEILKELASDGKTVILCDHDLSDYEAYIDHMVELRDGQLREINKIPTSEMTQVSSKEVASNPELFHMDRVTCELGNRPLFSIADFTFYQGISCILGDNGVGKSTLFRSILQFQKYKGLISWKGTVLKKKKKKSLYSDLTGVVQEAEKQFIRVSLREELQLDGPDSERNQRILQALRYFNLEQALDKSPYQLSGGQQKILQLLTILTSKASVILLDEPFAGLDDRACDYFCQWMLEESNQGRSFLIISHRLDPLISVVDYWIEMTSEGLSHLQEVTVSKPLPSLNNDTLGEVR
ncbi:ATP-binding cassette domain-containing protein [Streptococcus pneumoniae]|uniref:ATP-binding cassette domain-containing protein n=1 Tax=Streptococcus pneumoniae TaxID=1313 RepID=UPI0009DA684F|nr:ABC transporter ATP-binding protein [Streptococcus pneumoniae]MDG7709502.1 energy-coupling factor ABC transporter ATP-binding protein [Streptococcus pneumoniae]MDG7823416.1 energy-coupling factor ABC transporter ATP-binding protein [Streptococcus pneumoniae]MDG8075517.1 energy-coupling factor ABC transporter ATP-binding protein [Streptococcus pneumoniae]